MQTDDTPIESFDELLALHDRCDDCPATVESFTELVQLRVEHYHAANYPEARRIPAHTITRGQKYAKIWCQDRNRETGELDKYSKRIFAFVDMATGDIYKPASCKAPAKHVRGNIHSPDGGMSAVSPQGNCVVYMR